MAKWEGSQLNKAKEILAYELTELVHGEEEAKKARKVQEHCSRRRRHCTYANTELADEDFDEEGNIDLITLLVKAALVPTVPRDVVRSSRAVFPSTVRKITDINIRCQRMHLQVTVLSSNEAKRNSKSFVK